MNIIEARKGTTLSQALGRPERSPEEFQTFIRKSNILHRISDAIITAGFHRQRERIKVLQNRKARLKARGWIEIA